MGDTLLISCYYPSFLSLTYSTANIGITANLEYIIQKINEIIIRRYTAYSTQLSTFLQFRLSSQFSQAWRNSDNGNSIRKNIHLKVVESYWDIEWQPIGGVGTQYPQLHKRTLNRDYKMINK